MKQKSEFSIISRAMATVAGFDRVYRTLEQQVTPRGQAKSTFENYIHEPPLKSRLKYSLC